MEMSAELFTILLATVGNGVLTIAGWIRQDFQAARARRWAIEDQERRHLETLDRLAENTMLTQKTSKTAETAVFKIDEASNKFQIADAKAEAAYVAANNFNEKLTKALEKK